MTEMGQLWLVGAGPGDVDLLTLKAARLIGEADVLVHDGLIGPGVLDLARSDAQKISVEKRRDRHSKRRAVFTGNAGRAVANFQRYVWFASR